MPYISLIALSHCLWCIGCYDIMDLYDLLDGRNGLCVCWCCLEYKEMFNHGQ